MAASFTILAAVLFWEATRGGAQSSANGADQGTPTSATSGPTRTPTPKGPVLYRGVAPTTLPSGDFAPALPGEAPDIAFIEESEAIRIATKYFVPVAAIGAGVDSLTSDQLLGLLDGSITDWSEVDGIPGPVVPVLVTRPDDTASLERLLDISPAGAYADYAELRTAMTLGSGIIAMVPLDEVRANVTAIAVDGIDLVRGRGDPSSWPFATFTTAIALTADGEEGLRQLREEFAAPLPNVTTVIATGDILMSRCSLQRIIDSGDWASALRGPMAEYLASADLTLGSIDGSIQDINPPLLCGEHVNLSSPPEVMEALTLSGFDSVTLATNHIFDCGVASCGNRAFLRTIELFAEAGIETVGGGNNLEEALAPAILKANGITFGILGFDDVAAMDLEATEDSPGTAPLDDSYDDERAAGGAAFFFPAENLGVERFSQRITDLAQTVDVVIVQVQSGTEETHIPSVRSLKALPAGVAAGSVLVVGNQAHWVQALEVGEDWFVGYALGNFIYDQSRAPEFKQGYLLEATFWGAELRNVRLVPYQIENLFRPVFAEGELRAKILNDVITASLPLE
jgi:Bacterial capsule synthesis protein PGA_cap